LSSPDLLTKQLIALAEEELYREAELLQRVSGGDERAFSSLIEYYSAKVYAHVLTYIKSASLAEEITQDIFLKIWEIRAELTALTNFAGYLYVITRNRTLSELRKKLADPQTARHDIFETEHEDPSKLLEYRQLSDHIQQAIEMLPPRRRQIFKMSRFDGLTYEGIARELNISRGTVNEHIVEALLFLRSYLRNRIGPVLLLLLCYTCFIG